MTFGVTNEFNTNETAFINGKKVTVVFLFAPLFSVARTDKTAYIGTCEC